MHSGEEWDRADMVDRDWSRESERLTCGASALHAHSPYDLVCALEEEEESRGARRAAERDALRGEILAGLLDYLFAEGPDPRHVRVRAEGFLLAYVPWVARRVKGAKEWVSEQRVEELLHAHRAKLVAAMSAATGRAALSEWNDELCREDDLVTVQKTLEVLGGLLASQGETWRTVVATALCLAKAFRPELVGGMSLEVLAVLGGDAGGRATPSARIRRIYNDRLRAAGFALAQVHFQKNAGTVEKYRLAALGNSNRRKQKRTRTKR